MCDARAEGREERRTRRDRHLAGRSRALIDDILRVAAAICADAFAFVLWNLTARSPLQLARDLAGARRPSVFFSGVFRFVVGAMLLTGGGILLLPLVARGRDFVVVETIALIAALAVDQLVGPELRRLHAGSRPNGIESKSS